MSLLVAFGLCFTTFVGAMLTGDIDIDSDYELETLVSSSDDNDETWTHVDDDEYVDGIQADVPLRPL